MQDLLRDMFATEESCNAFKERYFEAIKPIRFYNREGIPDYLTIDNYGWDGVAIDIMQVFSSEMWNDIGDKLHVEILWINSRTGCSREILIGTLIEVPVPDPVQMADPEYHDDMGFLGGYIGRYIFG